MDSRRLRDRHREEQSLRRHEFTVDPKIHVLESNPPDRANGRSARRRVPAYSARVRTPVETSAAQARAL